MKERRLQKWYGDSISFLPWNSEVCELDIKIKIVEGGQLSRHATTVDFMNFCYERLW